MLEVIEVGALTLRFLRSKEETDGSLDMFEMDCPAEGRMPVAHHHRDWDETIYGVHGITTWTIAGREVDIGPGETVFIPRGTVHAFGNRSGSPATCLCVLTPGVLGPAYFREMGAALAAKGPPDAVRLCAIMERHGLIPVA